MDETFTEQELAVIAYGLEDHIAELNKNINYLDTLLSPHAHAAGELRRAHLEARHETQLVLAKVVRMIDGTY